MMERSLIDMFNSILDSGYDAELVALLGGVFCAFLIIRFLFGFFVGKLFNFVKQRIRSKIDD